MSFVKMSMFHWHIVDSQSFPFEIPGYTELAAKGAYSASSVYTPKDVADVISYAGAVSDRVVPMGARREADGSLARH